MATVEWTADQAVRRLLPEAGRTEWVDGTGGIALVERRLSEGWVGRKLGELEEPGRWKLVGLTRAGKARLADLALVAQENDVITVTVNGDEMDAL